MDKNIDLTMEDILTMIGLIKSAQQKGGFFEAEEMVRVGLLYNKLIAVAKFVQEKIKANQTNQSNQPNQASQPQQINQQPIQPHPLPPPQQTPNQPFFGNSFISN